VLWIVCFVVDSSLCCRDLVVYWRVHCVVEI